MKFNNTSSDSNNIEAIFNRDDTDGLVNQDTNKSISPNNINLTQYESNLASQYRTYYLNDSINSKISNPNYKVLKNDSISVNGLNGFDVVFQYSDSDTNKPVIVEYVVLQKGNEFITGYLELNNVLSSSNEFKNVHSDFMVMVNSLHVNK